MTLEELKQYYSNIDKCYGNCNTCYNYYICDYLNELIRKLERLQDN